MKAFIYILFFNCLCIASYAAMGDTTKTKYDINDPRNPNCPCHKYQKIADEEYQKQVATQQIDKVSKDVSEKIVSIRSNKTGFSFTAGSELNTKATASSGSEIKKVKVKRSFFSKRSGAQHKNHTPKKKRFRFGRKDNSRCTKW